MREWNPHPAANCEPIAFVMPSAILAIAMVTTMVLARRAPARLWVAAYGVCLCELSMPAAAEPHFVLFAIPFALMTVSPALIASFAVLYWYLSTTPRGCLAMVGACSQRIRACTPCG